MKSVKQQAIRKLLVMMEDGENLSLSVELKEVRQAMADIPDREYHLYRAIDGKGITVMCKHRKPKSPSYLVDVCIALAGVAIILFIFGVRNGN
jgi:hypothetical protein